MPTLARNINVNGVLPARRLDGAAERLAGVRPAWSYSVCAGRLVELSGTGPSAVLTAAMGLVADAQRKGETVAWIASDESIFFPPDAVAGGVDLEALVVLRLGEVRAALRAAEQLSRSGGFGLVVIDLGRDAVVPLPFQTRFAGSALQQETAVVCLTEKTARDPSLGSLVSLRGEARREKTPDGRFVCRVEILKDKRRGPGWIYTETCRGPDGLC